MPFSSVDRIITAKDYGGSGKRYIRGIQQSLLRDRGVAVTIKGLDEAPTGPPINAMVERGQWIAKCECGGACFVDYDEPVFFCFECLNRANDSRPRPVVFPEEAERKEIERLLLERPVDDIRGLTDRERAAGARPLIWVQGINTVVEDNGLIRDTLTLLPLARSWDPGETIDDLLEQQEEPIRAWRQSLERGPDVVQ